MTKILVIDDSNTMLNVIKDLLEQNSYEVFTAHTGEEGIEKAGELKPDVVVIDTVMPGIDGFSVCRRLREKNGLEKLKIIIMTGSVDAVDAIEARRAGADDYTVKTADCKTIAEAVENILR